MGEYSKALSFLEKAIEILKNTLPSNHPDLATSYNNIGMVYKNMGEYSKALSFLEKALSIFKETLPSNHRNIQIVQKNIDILKNNL
jgi:tetratricopeptide (TPR) repeat protein